MLVRARSYFFPSTSGSYCSSVSRVVHACTRVRAAFAELAWAYRESRRWERVLARVTAEYREETV